MRNTRRSLLRASWTIVLVGIICYSQRAKAGWTGLINGAGFGWASANERSATFNSSVVTTPSITSPGAAVNLCCYPYSAGGPSGASLYTHSGIRGMAGGIFSANTSAYGGDGADNAELEARVNIVPVNCATLTMDTSINMDEFNANGHSGNITVTGIGTAGTALWLRGFEYTGDPSLVPVGDPTSVTNASIEFLKLHGVWKFETLILGPFNFGGTNCPLIIPFTLDSGNINNLYFAADGDAKTVLFSIQCPPDVNASCGQSVNYPPVHVSGGCGNPTLSFSPTNGTVFPVGTNVVTVTATDEATNTVSCGFNVIVADNKAPVPPPLPDIISNGCTGTPVNQPPPPVATDNCAGSVIGTTTNQFPITALGTNLVWWKFDDGNGNITIASQRVIITGLTFQGFYSPINGINGACNQTVATINSGSVVPIKFDLTCGNNLVTSGTAPFVTIQNCFGVTVAAGPAVYQNVWHFNWDTSSLNSAKGSFQIVVKLPDGTSRIVFVKIK